MALQGAGAAAFPGASDGDSSFVVAVRQCSRISTWLLSVNSFIEKAEGEVNDGQVDAVREMQLSCSRDIFQQFPVAVQEGDVYFSSCLANFSESPLLKAGGDYNSMIMKVLMKAGQTKLAPVVFLVEKLLECAVDDDYPVSKFDPRAADKLSLQALVRHSPTAEVWNAVTSWAMSMGDAALGNQLNYIRNALSVVTAMIDARGIDASAGASEESVSLLKRLRGATKGLDVMIGTASVHPSSVATPYHVSVFQGLVDWGAFAKSLKDVSKEIQADIGTSWTDQIKAASKEIDDNCPRWKASEETMCADAVLVATMLENKAPRPPL